MTRTTILMMFLLIASPALAETYNGIQITVKDKASCIHDTFRYCKHLTKADGITRIALCLQENKSRLHESCVKTLGKFGL